MVHSVKRRRHVKRQKEGNVTNVQCHPGVRHNSQDTSPWNGADDMLTESWGGVHCC